MLFFLKNKMFWVDVGIFIFSLLIAYEFFKFSMNQLNPESTNIGDNFFIAVGSLILFFLTNITALLYKLSIRQSKNKNMVEKNHEAITSMSEFKKPNTQLMDILTRLLDQSDSILEATGRAPIDQFLKDFNVGERSIEFKSEALSLSSYIVFWRKLVELQRERSASGKKKGVVAKITHSGPIDVWTEGESATRLFSLQREFIEYGGKVIRVLIDHGSQSSNVDTYSEVYEKMKHEGIDVLYLPLNKNDFSQQHDFLVIDLESFVYVVRWTSDRSGRHIAESRITRYSKDDSSISEKIELERIAECLVNIEYKDGTPVNLTTKVKKELIDILKE